MLNKSSIEYSTISVELLLPDGLMDCQYGWNIRAVEIDYKYNWQQLNDSSITVKNNPFIYRLEFGIEYGSHTYVSVNDTNDDVYDDYEYYRFSVSSDDSFMTKTYSIDVYWDNVKNIRMNFSNLESFYVYSIKLYGFTPNECLECENVDFNYFEFDASDNDFVINDKCPSLTPLFATLYNGFIKSDLIDSLQNIHQPFILSLRNITLTYVV